MDKIFFVLGWTPGCIDRALSAKRPTSEDCISRDKKPSDLIRIEVVKVEVYECSTNAEMFIDKDFISHDIIHTFSPLLYKKIKGKDSVLQYLPATYKRRGYGLSSQITRYSISSGHTYCKFSIRWRQ